MPEASSTTNPKSETVTQMSFQDNTHAWVQCGRCRALEYRHGTAPLDRGEKPRTSRGRELGQEAGAPRGDRFPQHGHHKLRSWAQAALYSSLCSIHYGPQQPLSRKQAAFIKSLQQVDNNSMSEATAQPTPPIRGSPLQPPSLQAAIAVTDQPATPDKASLSDHERRRVEQTPNNHCTVADVHIEQCVARVSRREASKSGNSTPETLRPQLIPCRRSKEHPVYSIPPPIEGPLPQGTEPPARTEWPITAKGRGWARGRCSL